MVGSSRDVTVEPSGGQRYIRRLLTHEPMYAALTFPFVDVDRANKPAPGDGKHTNIRVRFVVALVLLAVVWQVVRFLVR
jgi:hypothetical protein